MTANYPDNKLTIGGGGIVGAMEAYFAYKAAVREGRNIRITIYEKNETIKETTTFNLVPSLTPREILGVVPRGQDFIKQLETSCKEPGGIRVDDVPGIYDSKSVSAFKDQALIYSKDEDGYQMHTQLLLELGKKSMQLWKEMYDSADDELRQILKESHFNSCDESAKDNELHTGYRILPIYNFTNASQRAKNVVQIYHNLGYKKCKTLSPSEAAELDPYLAHFCESHSKKNALSVLEWEDDSIVLYHPGGRINTEIFLPKFYDYLKKVMGQYTTNDGKTKNCFRIKYNRKVTGIKLEDSISDKSNISKKIITGLELSGKDKYNKHQYQESDYVFCPGEAVGTLTTLGLNEPANAGFSGASLKLNIPIPDDKLTAYQKLDQGMHVIQETHGVAWQAYSKNNMIFIGVGGTKAFYGDQAPTNDQDFAKSSHVALLNIMNDLQPECISLALGRETRGKKLSEQDLKYLENKGIAERWVGRRAAAYDGFPTLGRAYHEDVKIRNARCTTHLGSGGVSFSPAAVLFSRGALNKKSNRDPFMNQVLTCADPRRKIRIK